MRAGDARRWVLSPTLLWTPLVFLGCLSLRAHCLPVWGSDEMADQILSQLSGVDFETTVDSVVTSMPFDAVFQHLHATHGLQAQKLRVGDMWGDLAEVLARGVWPCDVVCTAPH